MKKIFKRNERTYREVYLDNSGEFYKTDTMNVDWGPIKAMAEMDKKIEKAIADGWELRNINSYMNTEYYHESKEKVFYYKLEANLKKGNLETKRMEFNILRDAPI